MSKLYMMIGLPASGKSTIAKEISKSEGAIIVSSDEIRKELLGNVDDQSKNSLIFETMEKRIKFYLANKQNVIFDATNINYKKRKAFLQRMRYLYNFEAIAVLIATPYEECLTRNTNRERKVPEEVIKRMYYTFYIPQYYEGFDEIQVKYNSNHMYFFDELKDMPQDNPHHKLTVLEHCMKTEEILISLVGENNKVLNTAGRLHDIGKLKTKTFVNAKGEITEIAHFYKHEKVSAYDSLFNIVIKSGLLFNSSKDETLDILKLIQWHMLPWTNMSEKTEQKYKKMLGEYFWNDLMILHKADCEAH